ncbi:MAG: hypothetical protein OXB89_07090 [Anaerolineaceae bacterium]|nr:hypothetical protein [Anaerolineaceae bacterium]
MSTVMLPNVDGQTVVAKTYSNARKLVQIGDLPVGVFTYGLGNLGPRTIYSHILEYGRTIPGTDSGQDWNVDQIAFGLSGHIGQEYSAIYDESEIRPDLGLHVAGFSKGSALPEEWAIEFPDPGSPVLCMGRDDVGIKWEGIELPFARLFYGYDARLLQALQSAGVSPLVIQGVLEESSLTPQVLFEAMPLQDAINFVVYVLQTTIGFTLFETGPSLCGGQLQIAVLSGETRFQWVSKPEFRIPGGSYEWA